MKTHIEAGDTSPSASRRLSISLALAALLLIPFATGCANIKASLALRPQIAIKVPGDESQIPADRVAKTNGWTFIHLAACHYDRRLTNDVVFEDDPSQWYLAFPTDPSKNKRLSWWSYNRQYKKARQQLPAIADAAKNQFGVYPTTLEVVNVFNASTFVGRRNETNRVVETLPAHHVAELERRVPGHISWPAGANGDPVWHLRSNYSQLEDARTRVSANRPPGPWELKVGIIDTGFSGIHTAAPRYLEEHDLLSDAWNLLSCEMPRKNQTTNDCKILKPSDTEGSHGTGTIGILAGAHVKIPPDKNGNGAYEGPLGGVPDATIVPVRVAPWVVSINTANFAYALDFASRVKQCDVISISHGGSPSMLWYDTINSAYWRGTAMVAASGDFISFGPFKRAIIPPPSSPIYPAAARRVLSVTGVTADATTYAAPTWRGFLRGLGRFKFLDSWVRGSYGADGSWRNLIYRDDKGDTVAARRQGVMRIHPIAAPAPNIPWLVAASEVKGKTAVIDFDGGGTSAATPQVAAAAALWLEHNRRHWTNLPPLDRWKKPEAVYQALLRTAHRPANLPWPNRYLGAGLLKANDALNRSFPDIINAPAEDKFSAFKRSPRDYFDGDKSFDKIVRRMQGDIDRDDSVTSKLKNRLKDPPDPTTSRGEALYRCFYNTRMLESWHKARNPDKPQRESFETKSKKDAAAAAPPGV